MLNFIKRNSFVLLGYSLILLVLIPQLFAIPDSSSLAIIKKHPAVLVGCFSFALAGYLYFLTRLSGQATSRSKRTGIFGMGVFVLLLISSPYLAGQGRVVWVYDTWRLEQKAEQGDPLSQIRMAARTLMREPDREISLPIAMDWVNRAEQNGLKGTNFYSETPVWFNSELFGAEESVLGMAAYNLKNSNEIRSRAICALNEIYPLSVPDERKVIDRTLLRMYCEFSNNATYSKGISPEAMTILKYAKVKSELKPKKKERSTTYFRFSYNGPPYEKLNREMRQKLEDKMKERESKLISPY
ncbi:hypothetical protein [Maridesulfovibrio sp.]|uniref:hypothetical protein n=1 Tax=Maridesulfovibrio sp. TaxID=2795000 RepID=UPI0029CA3DB9|nr:hypothetical protein [Maridesulfovibrio sp.]